jgi:CRISPR-associated protein Cas1
MTASPLGRFLEVAEDGRYLAKERGFLTIRHQGEELGRVPLDDLAAVMATSPATTVSVALLADLADRGIPFVLCGRNYAPSGLVWPLAGHHAQQRRMEAQLGASRPLAKRLWALLVAAKIRRQGWALAQAGRQAGAFTRLAALVKAGDPENIEAQAARRYWAALMGASFHRDTDGDGINGLLNYGYAVLRAATARAIVAAGLHPGLGVFHRHPHNAMPLADDLMEPFRPIVDLAVLRLADVGIAEVTIPAKRALAGLLQAEERTASGRTPLATCLIRLAASMADSFLTGDAALDLPILPVPRPTEPTPTGDGFEP